MQAESAVKVNRAYKAVNESHGREVRPACGEGRNKRP